MKKGWEIRKLSDLSLVFEDGDWIESKDQSIEGVRLIQTGNIGAGYFKDRGEKARYISEETFKKLRCTEIFEGDCLISRLPDPVGRACILPSTGEKMITAVDCTIIRFVKKEIIPEWFLFYSLSEEYQKEINKQVTGATRQRISRKNLGLINIPLPPLSEQRRIASILEDVFERISKAKENAERNLKNARELFESYLQGVFENKGEDWEEKTIGEIADVEYGYTDKSNDEGDYRYIRITDIDKNGELILEDKKYIKHSNEAEGFLIKVNDLLMARTGATFAKVLLYNGDEPSVFASYLIRILFKEKIENALYWYFTKTKYYWEQANSLQSGAAQPHFNGVALKQVIFSYPKSVKEQKFLIQKFETLSTEIKRLESIYQQKIEDLEELKKSVLQKAFSGALN